MVKKHTMEVDIHQLELELANLKVAVSDKEQQLAEAKLDHAINRETIHTQTDTSNNSRARDPRSTATTSRPAITATPPRAINMLKAASVSSMNSDHSIVPTYTGFNDCNRQKLYIDDIATLNKDSTRKFTPFFRNGYRVRLTRVTADELLYFQSLAHPLQTTTRASRNLTKISGGHIHS